MGSQQTELRNIGITRKLNSFVLLNIKGMILQDFKVGIMGIHLKGERGFCAHVTCTNPCSRSINFSPKRAQQDEKFP